MNFSLNRNGPRDLFLFLALVFLAAFLPASGQPIFIAPTTNFSAGNAVTNGLYGAIYNFNAIYGIYSVPNILNPVMGFGATQVGSYLANTSGGLSYGVPFSSDAQPLTTWLKGDGATVVYTAPHIIPVFNFATNQGTLLNFNGYIKVLPSMVNVPQTYSVGLDDGGLLVINGVTVINYGGIHSATIITQQVVFTRAGLYPISIGYYDGHTTEAVFTGAFGGTLVSTPAGVALVGLQLSPAATGIQNYLNNVGNANPTDPNFNHALDALFNLSLGGATAAEYGDALSELSPLKYAALDQQVFSSVDFITNDLDDYLAHRRSDDGSFRAGNGVDLSGVSVMTGNTDPALADVAGHLLAYNGGAHSDREVSDTPGTLFDRSAMSSPQRWNLYVRGIAVKSQSLSGGGLPHADATTGTMQIGADYEIAPHILAGAFFNYAHGSASLDEEGSSSTVNSYIPGVYASYAQDGWYLNGLAAGGVDRFDVSRNMNFPGFSSSAQSSPQVEEEYGYLSGGRDFHLKNWTIGPTAGLQYVHLSTDSFTERNAGLLDLDVAPHQDDSLRSRLGGRVYYAAADGHGVWRPFVDASWQHEFMQNGNSLSAQFHGADVGNFTVTTPRITRDSALLSVGTDVDLDANWALFTVYRLEAGANNYFAQSVEAGFKSNF